jgi:hypothetical protein
VSRVGEESEGVGNETAHELDRHEYGGQNENDAQPALSDLAVVVRVSGVRVSGVRVSGVRVSGVRVSGV